MKKTIIRILSVIMLVMLVFTAVSCSNQNGNGDETTAITETPEEKLKREAAEGGFDYEKDGRVLVWHDEFKDTKLDTTKWNFHRLMTGTDRVYDNGEKNARIEDGNMLLQVHSSDEEGKPYSLSESLTTRDIMAFKYGRIEMRAKIPFRHGAWPSFWMQSAYGEANYMAEIDIFENFSSENTVSAAIHKWGENGLHKSSTTAAEGNANYIFENFENLNNEYHIYALEWDQDYLHFYVDNVKYCSFRITLGNVKYDIDRYFMPGMQGFHDPAYIIMNNEIFSPGGSWCPESAAINENDELPINYYIDWVRLYQNPETDTLYLKDDIDAIKAAKEAEAAATTDADTQNDITSEQ